MIKSVLLIVVLFPLVGWSQSSSRVETGLGYFGSNLRQVDKRFQLSQVSLEIRPDWANQKLGIGLQSLWVSANAENQTEWAVGPQVSYHPAGNKKLDPFVSLSPMWSRAQTSLEEASHWHLKYSYGIRWEVRPHWKLSFEMANFRHASGLFPSPRSERKGGVLPAVGFRYVFRY